MEIFDLNKKVGYEFKDPKLLIRALTHSSYAHEHNIRDNERLEFLGDSVLSVIISEKLFEKFDKFSEGELSKMRASLVCEQSLEKVARKIDLGNLIRLGNGEERTGGRNRPSVVSDAFEALIAAIYLDSDIETVKAWVLNIMQDEIAKTETDKYFGDYKTHLQEIIQSTSKLPISYKIICESGAQHKKEFTIDVIIGDKVYGRGSGANKKEAEQNAAMSAVRKLIK